MWGVWMGCGVKGRSTVCGYRVSVMGYRLQGIGHGVSVMGYMGTEALRCKRKAVIGCNANGGMVWDFRCGDEHCRV